MTSAATKIIEPQRTLVVPEFNLPLRAHFLQRMFGRNFDLSNLHVPQKPDYPCWAVLNPLGITNNQLFEVLTKRFHGHTWRHTNDLDTIGDVVERPTLPHVVWMKALVEADDDLKNMSAEDIERQAINTLTFFERGMAELWHVDETGEHLDIENSTLCSASRCAYGVVPRVRWYPGSRRLFVRAARVRTANPRWRSRRAVS